MLALPNKCEILAISLSPPPPPPPPQFIAMCGRRSFNNCLAAPLRARLRPVRNNAVATFRTKLKLLMTGRQGMSPGLHDVHTQP